MPNDDLLIQMLARDDGKNEHLMPIDDVIKEWLKAREGVSKEIARRVKEFEHLHPDDQSS